VRPPPYDWWRTVFFLIPAVALYTMLCGIVSLLSTLVDRRGHLAHRCARAWAWLILKTTGVRVYRGGVAPPPVDASCVFVANHSSFYDIPILFTALPHQLRIIAKAALGRVPFIGWHLRLAGHLLVDRANPGAGIFKRMQRLTRQGASLIAFPEGSRTGDGRVGRFKGGVFLLAIENMWPVVPVAVIGSRTVMPRGRLMVAPAPVRVVVHEAIPTTGLTREDARALAGRVDAPLTAAAAAMRAAPDPSDTIAAVRTMYKRVGIDPTKTRPSSEALLRRVRKGGELPRINSLVDIINWGSLESQLPFGLYDLDRLEGDVTLRLGAPGEEYAGIRKDAVHLAGRLTLADARGPFGNPTSDSARSMVTPATRRALVVIFAPAGAPRARVEAVAALTRQRIGTYCAG
jgi:1-acyl-sn-glycerol-3-phosphate acyltransferase